MDALHKFWNWLRTISRASSGWNFGVYYHSRYGSLDFHLVDAAKWFCAAQVAWSTFLDPVHCLYRVRHSAGIFGIVFFLLEVLKCVTSTYL